MTKAFIASDPPTGFNQFLGRLSLPETQPRVENPDACEHGAILGSRGIGRDEPSDGTLMFGDDNFAPAPDQGEKRGKSRFGLVGSDSLGC
jgi:hypothetical protein